MKKIIYYAIPVIAIGLILFFGIRLWLIQADYKKAQDEYSELKDTMAPLVSKEQADVEVAAEVLFPDIQVNMKALQEINPDIVGWIYIESIDASYPIVQGEDNDYYLTHTFEMNSNKSGSIFMDCNAATDFSDRNTFIYGHNMKDGSMLGELEHLRTEPGLCEEYPHVYIYTENQVRKYTIYAYDILSPDSDSYEIFSTDEDYDAYIERTLARSEYVREDFSFTARPNLISLSTCSNHVNRFLVQCALVDTFDR